MRDKQSKKVVIINDINSDTIEQAILILKNSGIATATTAGQHIIEEAGNVINSYIKTVEKTHKGFKKSEAKKKSNLSLRIFVAILAMGVFVVSAYGFIHFYEMIINKF